MSGESESTQPNSGSILHASDNRPNTQSDDVSSHNINDHAKDHVVILLHGIRTWAGWYHVVGTELENAGFTVERTNYGRFDLLRFLLPISSVRRSAVETVARDVRDVFDIHNNKKVSIIAHSFGTYIISKILISYPRLDFNRLIFCGSIVPHNFRPADFPRRFVPPLLNEVGTSDLWPVVAESSTWGYGASGARGVQRPSCFDRYHKGVGHSTFLTAEFCRKYWIPFLNGESPKSADPRSPPAWWLDIMLFIKIKYLLLFLLVGMSLTIGSTVFPQAIYKFNFSKPDQGANGSENFQNGWPPLSSDCYKGLGNCPLPPPNSEKCFNGLGKCQ